MVGALPGTLGGMAVAVGRGLGRDPVGAVPLPGAVLGPLTDLDPVRLRGMPGCLGGSGGHPVGAVPLPGAILGELAHLDRRLLGSGRRFLAIALARRLVHDLVPEFRSRAAVLLLTDHA